MSLNRFKIVLVIYLSISASALSQVDVGGQAGAFLRRGVGSSSLSMGNAFTSYSTDASSVYWNPAGLSAATGGTEFLGSFSILGLDREEYFVALRQPIPRYFTIGAGWYRFGVKNIDGRDNLGNQTRIFNDAQNCLFFSLSKSFGIISIGATGKYIFHSVYDYYGGGFSFDIGTRISLFKMIYLGFVAQDILGKIKWNTPSTLREKFPIILRGGITLNIKKFLPVLVGETVKIQGQKIKYQIGTELKITDNFGIRGGYRNNDLTFGGFLQLPAFYPYTTVDYAFTKDVILDNFVHSVSLTVKF